jgi:micrococcal nuclease
LARRRKRSYALSRRKRAALIGIGLIGMALLAWLDQDFIAPHWSRSSSTRAQTFATDFTRYHGGTFPVVRVVDGDTLHLAIPDSSGMTTKVRLVGVDAPELGGGTRERMYFGAEAATFAERLAMGKRVTVHLDEQAGSRDRYGRLLAYLELPDGKFLNEQLLLEGYAYADVRFRHSYYQKYQQLEASARTLKEGLWAGVTPEQMPAWLQRMQSEPAAQP